MSIEQFFPCLPDYSTWEDWNGNLIMFYAEEAIPYMPEDQWQVTANNVSQLPTFQSYPVPDPAGFEAWQDWALAFTEIINGPSR